MLRPYITQALTNVRKEYVAGACKQLICMATGTGKTHVFSHIPEYMKDLLPGQSMVLLHRDELAKQAMDKLREINPTYNVQQEAGAEKCDPTTANVIVASVQTLGRKNTERVKKFNWEHIDKYVVDEAHRSIAESYYNVYEAGGLFHPNNKSLLLGVTATPGRGDGQGLGKLYDKISFTYSLRQAIEEGWLVDVKGVRVDTETSLDGVSTKGGDYDQGELAETVNTPARNNLVASSYLQTCPGRHAIGFGVDIQHSKDLAKMFQDRGINADAVWGADPDRDEKIKAFRDGKIQVLFNAQLLVEGFDVPSISCVILAAPTKSGVVFSQRVGRGTRLFLNKYDCIILDVVDSTSRHNLITLPTLLGLPAGLNLQGNGLVAAISQIEKQQELFPHIDFTSLKDIDKLYAYIEEVNLWEPKIPSEIDSHTEMVWHPAATGGYVMMLPEKDEIRITQNILDKWELRGKLKGKKFKGERDSLDAIFSAADTLVKTFAPDVLKLVQRDAPWHKLEPTPGQLKVLKKIYKGKSIPYNMTRGWASKLIGAGKAQKG